MKQAKKQRAYNDYTVKALYYIADMSRLITENTARLLGGTYSLIDFRDFITPKPEETRTAEEIIDNIKKKLGQ